jgi:hypothetical protein
MSTISLSNLTTSNINLSTFNHIFNFDDDTLIKKVQMYESPEDFLVLSVTRQRVFAEKQFFYSLTDSDIIKHIIPEDRDKARLIREYYSKKLMMAKLCSDNKTTKFREDLATFLCNAGLTLKEKDLGMVFKLPEFYDYDQIIDTKVKANVNIKVSEPTSIRTTDDLVPLTKVIRASKKSAMIEYWLKRSNENAVCISIAKDNPLIKIWDKIFDNNATLKINGQYITSKFDNFSFYNLRGWELL